MTSVPTSAPHGGREEDALAKQQLSLDAFASQEVRYRSVHTIQPDLNRADATGELHAALVRPANWKALFPFGLLRESKNVTILRRR